MSCTHVPESMFALGTKLLALLSVQPDLAYTHPLETVASESKLSVCDMTVQPIRGNSQLLGDSSTVAIER